MKAERTCIGCRKTASKASLVRINRSSTGDVVVDASGKAPGRGAYVCSRECFERVASSGRLAAALKVNVDREKSEALLRDLRVVTGR